MISMGKKKSTALRIGLGGTLAMLLAGCMSQNGNLKAESNSNIQSQPVKENTHPISTARAQAVAAADEQRQLIEALDAAQMEDDEVALGDDELIPEDEAELVASDDPTAEDEGAVGEAVFDAAQDLLDKTTLEEEAAHNSSNIWPRVRAGFTLIDRDHPRNRPEIEWFSNHQAYLDRTFTRAAPYLHYIVEEVEKRNMPTEIALLPVVESAFQPFAYSRSRAAGIWQFIPGTANLYGLKINWWYDGRRDIHASTHAALTYLQKLHKQFNGDWLLALAAYNSGEGTVSRAIARNESLGLGTRFWDLDLPRETRSYVPRLLAVAEIVENPDKFGVTIRNIPNKPLLQPVNIGAQLDLAIAADMAGLTLDELYTFNPGFNRWATAPNGPHRLLLPLETVETFKTKLAALPANGRMQWTMHEVKRGDSLGKIAKQYGVTVAAIQRANNLSGKTIHPGKTLTIPMASRSGEEYILSADQRLVTKQNAPASGRKATHVVRSGETLWRIATRHKVDVKSLAAWNDMATTDTLRSGQKLVIWKGSRQTVASRDDQADKAKRVKYRVRNGDSLARISKKFNVSVSELREWNPKVRGKHIQPGQQLVVYVDVT